MEIVKHVLEFPGLGLKFNYRSEFPLFNTSLTIKWYGILIAVGFLLAVVYALRRVKDFDIDPDRMIDVVLVCTVLAFVGARLYYVLFSVGAEREAFFENPITMLYIWEGGIGIYGGLIAAFLSGLLMCRIRKVNTLAMFDLASLGFLIGQGVGRWGNFINQEAFGGNTTLPWGMTGDRIAAGVNGSGYDPALPVHPTFLYESLWCILGFVLLHILSKKAYRFKGQIFSLYLVWYGTGRFFIELLRTDSLMLGNMKVSCFVAVLAVLAGIMLYLIFRNTAEGLSRTLVPAGADTLLEPETAEAVEAAGKTAENAEDAIDEAVTDTAEAVEAAEETAENAEDAIDEAVADTAEAVEETVADTAEAADETIRETISEIKEEIENHGDNT